MSTTLPNLRESQRLGSAASVIRISGVSKQFRIQKSWGDLLRQPFQRELRSALLNVSLDIRRGEFFGLLGQNGAGKSTLFRILAGLVTTDSGDVEIDGVNLKQGGRQSRALLAPVIASERSLYWRLPARENLRLYGALYGLRGTHLLRRIEEVLTVVGLADTGRKQAGLFSSGMKQRLLIARALLPEPRILLLDEPTRSLDPVSARDFRRFLREEIGQRQGCTVLIATHDHQEVRELCDRIGILHRGKLLFEGTTEDVLGALDFQRLRIRIASEVPPDLLARLEHGPARLLEITPPDGRGWRWLRLQIANTEEPEALLTVLVEHGIRLSRVEREELSLADLLEGVARKDERAEGVS